ncbi:serine/threonine-protein kinase [Streptomyces parvus]|uniref:serine/threonine-protein kinase n=1 Tax=Streptomyces parvus TaxID=66428 RepID=UPI003D743B11
MHGAGVVHRDLKPANVLLAEDGPRVIDFGIARAADAAHLTGTGVRIGTAAYMAPEQAMGLPVTPAVDVFALGALAAAVAGGAPPFGPGPESATLYRVAHEPPDLSRVPPELHDLLWGCLAKQPELRPAPNDIIAAVHAHPCVAPAVEFTHGWLPPGLYGEIGQGDGHGPSAPVHLAPTRARPTPTRVGFAPDAEAAHGPDLPAATGGASAGPGAGARPDARRRRTGRWPRGALVGAACLLVLAAAVAVPHLRDRPDRADASSSPAPRRTGPQTPVPDPSASPSAGASAPPPARYEQAYADAELTAPDESYEFDLRAGEVVPAETSDWFLARSGDAFVLPENSDAFVGAGYVLGPADCERGIGTEPVTELFLDDLADERPFCVRSPDGEELVIVRLVHAEVEEGDGPATVVLSRYTRGG